MKSSSIAQMAILFFFPWGLDELGGAQVSVPLLAHALRNRGHRVGIVEMARTPSLQNVCRFDGPVWTMPVVHPPRRPWSWRSWRGFLRSTYYFQRIIRTFKPDIVSVQCFAPQSFSFLGICALPHRWRLVVTIRAGSEISFDDPRERRLRMWLHRLLRRADAVTAVSEALRHDLTALYPFVGRRGRAILNGIDPLWFTPPAEPQRPLRERYVLYIGRFALNKGVDVLLQAWWQMQADVRGIGLWLAGDGPERGNLQSLAQALGIASQVRFMGRILPQDLRTLYARADLVVQPSRRGGEGLRVLLEAGASGAICVATRVGGTSELIDDMVTGFLVEPESPRDLADGVLRGLRLSAVERRMMSDAARKRIAEHFSHERTIAAYERLFRSLLEVPRPASMR